MLFYYWQSALQLISSSLGYGNINHWPSETDGTSPISKAAKTVYLCERVPAECITVSDGDEKEE